MESACVGEVQPLLFQSLLRNLEASHLVLFIGNSQTHVIPSGIKAVKTER